MRGEGGGGGLREVGALLEASVLPHLAQKVLMKAASSSHALVCKGPAIGSLEIVTEDVNYRVSVFANDTLIYLRNLTIGIKGFRRQFGQSTARSALIPGR